MVQQINGQSAVKISGDVIDINGSSIVISADRVDLSAYVTITELEATDAKINNLTSGATTAASLKTNLLSASTGFTYQSQSVSWKSLAVGTSVTPTWHGRKTYALDGGGTDTANFLTNCTLGTTTINYLGR